MASRQAVYLSDIPVNHEDQWVSNKLDGVCAIWDGANQQLLTRKGSIIRAPHEFTTYFPKAHMMRGELWIGVDKFDEVSGLVRSHSTPAIRKRWLESEVAFYIFDLPQISKRHPYSVHYKAICNIVEFQKSNYLRHIKQETKLSRKAIGDMYTQAIAQKHEGLMLRDNYSHELVKLKPVDTDEGIVTGHDPGFGRNAGRLGALIIKWKDKHIKLGTGLSDMERENPPAIGSWVTFSYNGLTKTGTPRFARYLRGRFVS